MFDTHCHLQFHTFTDKVEEVLKQAHAVGVTHIMMPGTDVETSRKAVEMAKWLDGKMVKVYAAVGIHPHHVFDKQFSSKQNFLDSELANRSDIHSLQNFTSSLNSIEVMLQNKKALAIGEVGIDRYYYRMTKYSNYQVTNEFINLQKEVMKKQIKLALKYDKSLILHNREAIKDFLEVLSENWDKKLEGRTVFHCCEPEEELLDFAKQHKIFLGVDGDVTYSLKKEAFIKEVPLDMLVLETDSPFLTPEPLRSHRSGVKSGPDNEPKNLPLIAEFIAKLNKISVKYLTEITTENAKKLFQLP